MELILDPGAIRPRQAGLVLRHHADVRRRTRNTYHVPSATRPGVEYIVALRPDPLGWRATCPCEATVDCWHVWAAAIREAEDYHAGKIPVPVPAAKVLEPEPAMPVGAMDGFYD
jgi:hypothetical protein